MSADGLPIYVHDYVLGADIGVRQRANEKAARGERAQGRPGVDVTATGDRPYIDSRERRYLAAWARRNLFGGAPR